MKDKLTLKNGTVIELEAGASMGGMQVLSPDISTMAATWAQFTQENLSAVQINSNGFIESYTSLLLVSETSVIQSDDRILTTYCLREKTAIEKRLDALEGGQGVQNDAIVELAE